MFKPARFFFGQTDFGASEEYLEFQFKFLCIVQFTGALFTALLLLGVFTSANLISLPHVYSMSGFTAITLGLWLLLRGNKQRFYPLAWAYEAVCMLEYISALAYVPEDELRILWFFTNIPGVYILLGQRAGMCITLLTVAGLALGNSHLSAPYSPNAMATALLSMIYLGMFFHVYGNRSISYFARMRESNRQLHHMATHDTLTGVMNARAYYAACDQMIHLAKRNNTPYAVLFVDLDHFKRINDTLGHAAGDVVLKSVAQTLAAKIRQSDAVGRIGGEEFSVFLPNTDLAGALKLAEAIRLAIENLMPLIGGEAIKITASIGVARNQHSDQTMLEIQQQADQAMYEAKAQGRNRVSAVENPQPA